jgi:hypothetical protein
MALAQTKGSNEGDRPLRVVFSRGARANLKLRAISVSDVEKALREGSASHIDSKTGHLIFRVDDRLGSIRVVAERAGESIVILTAMRREEFANHGG